MPTPLCVRADASSILRNILNYFSDNFACIQELLQNARRAEASEVRVEIDTRSGSDAALAIDSRHKLQTLGGRLTDLSATGRWIEN